MKKYKKWIASLLVAVLCLSLSGCKDLEEMRAEHAVWQEDGSILWNGCVYREVEDSSAWEKFGFVYDYITIYVTEEDVPVLLSDWFGEMVDVRAGGTVLSYCDYRYVEPDYHFYCREDAYDEMMAKMENGIDMTTYFYDYYDFDAGKSMTYYLTEEQANAIRRTLSAVMPIPEDEFEDTPVDNIYLSMCDDSHYFEQLYQLELYITDFRYCIKQDGYIYVVSLAYNSIFEEIWQPYNESNNGQMKDNPPSMVV